MSNKIILGVAVVIVLLLGGATFLFLSLSSKLDLVRIENLSQIKNLNEKLDVEQKVSMQATQQLKERNQQIQDLEQTKKNLEEQLAERHKEEVATEKDPKAVQFLNDNLPTEVREAIGAALRKEVKFTYGGELNAFVDIDSQGFIYFLHNPKSVDGAISEVLKSIILQAVHAVLIEASEIDTGKTFTQDAENNLINLADKADIETQKEFYLSMIDKRFFQNWGTRCLTSEASDEVKIAVLKAIQEKLPGFLTGAGITSMFGPMVIILNKILTSDVSEDLKAESTKTIDVFLQSAQKNEITDLQNTMQNIKQNALLYKEKKHVSPENMKAILTRLNDVEIERHVENIRSVFGSEVEVVKLREDLKKLRDQYKSEIDVVLQGML